jgi:hypothetical protein
MHLCYLDESGTPQSPGTSSHYILAGIAIPVEKWKESDAKILQLKQTWQIQGEEIHTAWMMRKFPEESKISGFKDLTYNDRREEVRKFRTKELLRLQGTNPKQYHKNKKNYRKTEAYVHLTHVERKTLISDFAKIIGDWDYARLFAECIDKIHFNPTRARLLVEEQAFEQVVSRFEQYLQIISTNHLKNVGLLIHDNNQTVAKNLTELMVKFHKQGTFWTSVENIIETPLFVDSQLTCMVQVADLCSYALRRYLENGERDLFNKVFARADRKDGRVVGVRHFSENTCKCEICNAH